LFAAYAGVAGAAIAIAAGLGGRAQASAALAGAAAAIGPQAWFAWRALRRRVLTADAATMLRAMYLGEAVKLVAIVVILAGIFRYWPDVPALPLLMTFVAVQAVNWVTPLLLEG
jgi:F0F1-type ATP synthase assembly protein I